MSSLDTFVAEIPTRLVLDPRATLERARQEFERGRLKEAIEMLELVVAAEKDHAAARTMLAVAYARTRRIERAFEHLEQALVLDPQGFAPRCALGELYIRLGIPEQGREHLDLALARATTPEERAYVQALLKEERAMARHRMPRPAFRQPFGLWRRPEEADE
jgi:tetratricopeptide (TPR) repeat protein